MAHFAQVINNEVVEVIVIANADCDNLPFPESEPVGQAFIDSLGIAGDWLQTSYSGSFRGRYAGVGYEYSEESDTFVAPEVIQP
jgi:hypothetical protein